METVHVEIARQQRNRRIRRAAVSVLAGMMRIVVRQDGDR
jgi:hypothetical protein